MVSDYKKLFLRIFSGAIIGSIIFGFLYFFDNYLHLDLAGANKAFNSKIFGTLVNLFLLNLIPFIWDWTTRGYTLPSILDISPDSSPEDKKNATNFMCCILLSNAYVVSFQ